MAVGAMTTDGNAMKAHGTTMQDCDSWRKTMNAHETPWRRRADHHGIVMGAAHGGFMTCRRHESPWHAVETAMARHEKVKQYEAPPSIPPPQQQALRIISELIPLGVRLIGTAVPSWGHVDCTQ